jgi:uncharacterized protein
MKIIFIYLFLISSLAFTGNKNRNHPPFFRLEMDGRHCGYLFGTLHIVSMDDLPDVITAKLAECHVFFNESETNMDALKEQLRLQSKVPLSQRISPKAWAKLKKLLTPRLTEEELEFMLPGVLAVGIMVEWGSPFLKLSNGSLDSELSRMASERGLPIRDLDKSVIDLVGFAGGVVSDQVLETILEYDWLVRYLAAYTLRREVRKYLKGTVPTRELTGIPPELLQNRNALWVPAIVNSLFSDLPFIAIGANHLWGKNGVIELLRQKGVTVTSGYSD